MSRLHTLDLFEPPAPPRPAPSTMDYRRTVSALAMQALKDAPDDRHAVAARMSSLTGRPVSKLMLDGYTAESRESFNLPTYLVPALEVATSSYLISQWLAEVRGGRLLVGRDVINAEIGRLQRVKDDAARRLRHLKRLGAR